MFHESEPQPLSLDCADLLVIKSTSLSADADLADRVRAPDRRVGDAPSECLDAHDPIKRTTVLAVTDGLAVLGGWLIFLSLLVALGVLLARPPS